MSEAMHIPAYLNRHDAVLPEHDGDAARCIIAGNGNFLERRSPMFSTSIRVNLYDLDLARHEEYCRLTCGRIPRVMYRAMLSFFKCAQAIHGGEAALVLLYHPQRKAFRWHCPQQVVDMYQTWSGWTAGDLIEYDNPLKLPDGYVHFGDAHLHFGSPTPSSVDIRDDQDGLHIIVGTIQSTPAYHVAFVMDGARFQLSPEAIFEDPHCRPFGRTPRSWLDQIRVRTIPQEPTPPPRKPTSTKSYSPMENGRFDT
jgi:hypothetical protein